MPAAPLPRTCCPPKLWLRPGQAVYVGPSLRLGPHSGSVACLAVAVGGTCTVQLDGVAGLPVRSALVPARVRHRVVADAPTMAFSYVDPASVWHASCQRAMTVAGGNVSYGHRNEQALATAASGLSDAEQAQAWFDLVAGSPAEGHPERRTDQRIARVVAALHGLDPHDTCSAAQLAALVGLSTSRLLHLFREQTGTSLRRYRLWLRMLRAAELLHDGADLTTCAVGAGFASPSHFSTSFRAMFGLRPGHLLEVEIHLA